MSSGIENKCIQRGVRLTDQRKLVARIMSESADHPNVDELHKRVSKIDSKISKVCNKKLKRKTSAPSKKIFSIIS